MTQPYADQALAHKTVILTRRPKDAAAWVGAFEALGARVVVVPSLSTALLPCDVWRAGMADLAKATCVAFASRQGVEALGQALLSGPWSLPAAAALWAVGPATAEAARALWGREVRLQPPYTAEGLAQGLLAALRPGCDIVVLPGAAQGRTHVAQSLLKAGIAVTSVPLYRTTPIASPRPQPDHAVDYVVFTSPSSVAGWLLGGAHPQGARCISIGPTTSQALVDAGLTVFAQASKPSLAGLLAAILEQKS